MSIRIICVLPLQNRTLKTSVVSWETFSELVGAGKNTTLATAECDRLNAVYFPCSRKFPNQDLALSAMCQNNIYYRMLCSLVKHSDWTFFFGSLTEVWPICLLEVCQDETSKVQTDLLGGHQHLKRKGGQVLCLRENHTPTNWLGGIYVDYHRSKF